MTQNNNISGWLKTALTTSALILVAAASLPAQNASRVYREGSFWVEDTSGDLPAASAVRVRADLGSVTVQGSNQGSVHWMVRKRVSAGSEEEARRIFGTFRFGANRSGDQDVLVGEVPSREWRRGAVQMIVNAPKSASLVKVSTRGGDVSVREVDGRAEVDTGGGNVNVDDIGSYANVTSNGGNVFVGTVRGDLRLHSGSGSVTVTNVGRNAMVSTGGGSVRVDSVHGDLMVDTGAGNLIVKQVGGGLRASTGGGSLELGDVGGQVAVETGGGSIRLNSGTGVTAETGGGMIQCFNVKHGLRASTAGGGIVAEFIGRKDDFSDSHLEAGVGDITVYLPVDLGVNVIASIDFANGHTIQSEFKGLRVSQSNGFGPQEMSAEGRLNGGGPTLKLHTTTGNIMLRRVKK